MKIEQTETQARNPGSDGTWLHFAFNLLMIELQSLTTSLAGGQTPLQVSTVPLTRQGNALVSLPNWAAKI